MANFTETHKHNIKFMCLQMHSIADWLHYNCRSKFISLKNTLYIVFIDWYRIMIQDYQQALTKCSTWYIYINYYKTKLQLKFSSSYINFLQDPIQKIQINLPTKQKKELLKGETLLCAQKIKPILVWKKDFL